MQREALRRPWQLFGHVIGVGAGWILFFFAWIIVFRDNGADDFLGVTLLIGATLVVSPAITIYWVWHTLAIFRAKGARPGNPAPPYNYNEDWNGTPVVANWPELRAARITVVEPCDKGKQFRSVNRVVNGDKHLPAPLEIPARA